MMVDGWMAVTVQFMSNFPYNISVAYTISVQGGSEGFLSLTGLPAPIWYQSGHEHCKVHLNKQVVITMHYLAVEHLAYHLTK